MTSAPPGSWKVRVRRPHFWDLFPLIWLIWLIYPVQAFMAAPRSWDATLVFWVSVVAFVGIYARTFMQDKPDDRWAYAGWLAGLLMWGLGLSLYGPSSFAFLLYGASLIGWQEKRSLALVGALVNAALLTYGTLSRPEDGLGDLLFVVFIFVAAYGNSASYSALMARRKLAQVQLEKEKLAADAERERIARDLHDLLGHTLSVIVLKSELAGKLAEKYPARAAEEIRDVERISREALQEVRSAVRGYRGSGFGAELARAKVALDTAGIKLSMLDTVPDLPESVEASAAMLLREAVTNVVRHAQASEVKVGLWAAPGEVTLTVHDNGIGGHAPEGTGLNSMRERLRAMGGTLERDGHQGTRLTACWPLTSLEHA
ncbi:sensor histidine kinase [Deinococcus wulumuqiensis]|uniref:sensor histidine kinase n=1 Tax=Deinococcus wulumuqiensis TaxID=980427 RepID=UPI001F075655|nr:sensor histidine kinase [Deinococcus wulumuqiensis]